MKNVAKVLQYNLYADPMFVRLNGLEQNNFQSLLQQKNSQGLLEATANIPHIKKFLEVVAIDISMIHKYSIVVEGISNDIMKAHLKILEIFFHKQRSLALDRYIMVVDSISNSSTPTRKQKYCHILDLIALYYRMTATQLEGNDILMFKLFKN
jgi:hypothetical protein